MTNKKTVLITGVNGFVGQHLANEFKAQNYEVIGTGLTPIDKTPDFCDQYFGGCDLTKSDDVQKLPLDEVDSVVNLAGLAQMGASFMQEDLYMRTNVAVHTTIAERLLELGKLSTRVVAVSSGAVYDNTQPMPLAETAALAPQSSPYSRSKITMEESMAGFRERGLDVVVARPFNHIGPGQTEGFLIPDLSKKISDASNNEITVGNLKTRRDYTDVRDVAKAYVLLATLPDLANHTYNVCSGRSVSGETILGLLVKALGKPDIEINVDTSSFRPNDAMEHFGDNSRIKDDTGWAPSIPLEQTISDFTTWYKNEA